MKKSFLFILALLLLWAVLSFIEGFKGVIPKPLNVFLYLVNMDNIFELYGYFKNTIFYAVSISLVGVLIGHSVGLIASLFHWSPIYKGSMAMKAIPVTLFIPVMFSIFGFKMAIPILIGIPIVALSCVNCYDSCTRLSAQREHVSNFIGFTKAQYLVHISFWESIESLFISIRLGWTYSLSLVIAFDYFIGVINGIGQFALTSSNAGRDIEVFSAIIIVSVVALLVAEVIDFSSRKCLKWHY